MLYKVKISNANGETTFDEISADNEAQVVETYKMLGRTVIEATAVQREDPRLKAERDKKLAANNQIPTKLPSNLPAPNLDNIKELMGEGAEVIDRPGEGAVAPQPQQQPPQGTSMPNPSVNVPSQEKEVETFAFQDPVSGIEYKVLNGKIFKKDWVECNKEKYRVIKKTKTSSKNITNVVVIEKMDWVKLAE